MNQSNFPAPDKKTINEQELEILKYWKENNIFQNSIDSRSPQYEFRFFDGPPFATGSPHYGHILAGAIKDAIPRYKTMCGYRVDRKWGWDCHGVPVEFLIEKENKIGGKPGIEKMGVGNFNELCRDAVMRCADEWEDTVDRMGRFVDFKNDYKTMDPEFMESVWWVFKTLWDKGLIYEGEKIVPYSPKLGSPLSNFEANLNYQDIDDPAVTVKFELKGEPRTYFLAWTTTPWTLPSHLLLCVNPHLEYSQVSHKGEMFIVAHKLVEKIFKEDFYIVETVPGEFLVGKEYTPPFPFYKDHQNAFRVVADDFVGETDGTGIVHLAPTGEDDARILNREKVELVYPFTDNGFFDASIPELEGKYFRYDPEIHESKDENANKWVLEHLGDKLFKREQIRHSYPHCWRTDCALMYRGIKTWFVNVEKIKDQMIEQNENVNWLPEHLKHGRFGKILESAPDWAISRNRYWGAPIPVWRCNECGHIEVMGSQKALEEKAGQGVPDLHKHFVDDLTWDCPKCLDSSRSLRESEEEVEHKGVMQRIPEVLDCWFESGSMPYASVHYPFNSNHPELGSGSQTDFLPADFIAEGLDQTRGWFYTLHVLGCALFGKNIYKNVITNGIVLAEDGQKMSKSKKNYPDPNLIFQKYGADAMRFYMLSSPVVRAENFRFAETGVNEVLKTIILPLKSTYQFFSTYANIDSWQPTKITFIRHGEGSHNVSGIYSGRIDNPHPLTEKGRADIEKLKSRLPDFDAVYSSPFVRTQQTATILFGEENFQVDDRLGEIDFGDLEGAPYRPVMERLVDPSGESLESVQNRMVEFIREKQKQHRSKNIAVVSHGGPIRYGRAYFSGYKTIEQVLQYSIIRPGEYADFFPLPEPKTKLDQWILSEIQIVLAHFREKMDAYKIDEALRVITPFIDQLNNWFLRRSRKRFWDTNMTEEKISGYETLHYVLRILAEILAPICPFFAEKLYRDLTGGESVHLQNLAFPQKKWFDQPLSEKISLMREIVSLSAGIRARKKIKLRQPLTKISISIAETQNQVPFTKEDLEIIAQEANVKNVEILSAEKITQFAKKIIKVDARQVGKKFGKKVQTLIQEGKAGNFQTRENGQIEIAGETLDAEEYEVAYLTAEGIDADATPRTVVLLETEITEDLRLEGIAREIIRAIQEKRKSSGFEISDRIFIQYMTDSEDLKKALEQFEGLIAGEVLAESLVLDEEKAFTSPLEIEGQILHIALTKQ
jgi:isoleucyl-tRNA synthetase